MGLLRVISIRDEENVTLLLTSARQILINHIRLVFNTRNPSEERQEAFPLTNLQCHSRAPRPPLTKPHIPQNDSPVVFQNNELAILMLTLQRRKPHFVLQHLALGLPPWEAPEMRTLQEAPCCPGGLSAIIFVNEELPRPQSLAMSRRSQRGASWEKYQQVKSQRNSLCLTEQTKLNNSHFPQ